MKENGSMFKTYFKIKATISLLMKDGINIQPIHTSIRNKSSKSATSSILSFCPEVKAPYSRALEWGLNFLSWNVRFFL